MAKLSYMGVFLGGGLFATIKYKENMFIYNILTKWSVRGLTLPGVFSLVFVYPYLVARTTCKANTCLSRISLQRDIKDLQCDF